MHKKDPKKFVGEIFLRRGLDNKNDYLVYNYKNGISVTIINDPLLSANGNDTVIYLKTEFMDTFKYYKLTHDSGKVVISLNTIDSSNYVNKIREKHFKYSFSSH